MRMTDSMRYRRPAPVRKRKRARVETPVVAETRAAGDLGPPPGAGEDAADSISLIPDALLGEIVSLLPIKDGARTQVLASRWRHIWGSAPLNLDCGSLSAPRICNQPIQDPNLDHVVLRILAAHQGPGRRLCVPADYDFAAVEAWFSSPAVNNLQQLEFYYAPRHEPPGAANSSWRGPVVPPAPASTFRFAATLSLANIGKCHLPDNTVQGLHFPHLKHLALHWVRITECSIHSLIAKCPALECLLIYSIVGFRCLRINAVRLRSIGVRMRRNYNWLRALRLEELVIENAPCLERLLRFDPFDGVQVSVISAPKLETLGLVDYADASCPKIIKGLGADSLTTARLVKILAVHIPLLDLDTVIDLMRCFPCLEKLYIQDEYISKSDPKNFWRRKHKKLIGCLDIHLKTIVFETYHGIVSDVNFASFFVLNAKELELMTIHVETIDEKFIARQKKLLQLRKKASRGARFHFTTDKCFRDIGDISDVCDLDLTDPFVR